jgi:hypothetical protein
MITLEIKKTVLQCLCLINEDNFRQCILEKHPEIKKVVVSSFGEGKRLPIYLHFNSGRIFMLKLLDNGLLDDTLIRVMEVRDIKNENNNS